MTASLLSLDHTTVRTVAGPLRVAERCLGVRLGEIVDVLAPDGGTRRGQVLELDGERAVVQVFDGTSGLDRSATTVRARGRTAQIPVGTALIGRILDGAGRPIDDGPPIMGEAARDINGSPLNPVARAHPSEAIETGISAIDGLTTLVRGQKLPVFSGFGLPAGELAARIATGARVPTAEGDAPFVVVFAAMGATQREAAFYRDRFAGSDALARSILLLNRADDPAIERIITPRAALTIAEHLAFERGLHVLCILTDMTAYCEALREISAAREEMPGRRGYPGYLYTDLASIYERAGRVHGRPGSLTQLMLLSMPDDDITHPIPDLTGYITEGQVVLSRELHRRGIDPPIDVLPSLSRLMGAGVGAGRTREDHRPLADQLYAIYARGRAIRRLVAIIGEAALSDEDRRALRFAEAFETDYIGQGPGRRTLDETFAAGWQLLADFPDTELKRIKPELIARYR